MPRGAAPFVYLYVTDRAAAHAFYRHTLELVFDREDDEGLQFLSGDVALRVVPTADHVSSPHPVFGWVVEDLVAHVRALAAAGVTFEVYDDLAQDADGIWRGPDGRTQKVWFRDPAGNVLMLTQES